MAEFLLQWVTRAMSDLRRPLLTVVALGVVCLLIALFVFPGPGQVQSTLAHRMAAVSHLSSVGNLGAITPQTTAPVAPPAPTQGSPSGEGQGGNGTTVLVPTTTVPPTNDNDPVSTTTQPPLQTTTTTTAGGTGGQRLQRPTDRRRGRADLELHL